MRWQMHEAQIAHVFLQDFFLPRRAVRIVRRINHQRRRRDARQVRRRIEAVSKLLHVDHDFKIRLALLGGKPFHQSRIGARRKTVLAILRARIGHRPELAQRRITNPDAPDDRYCITLQRNGALMASRLGVELRVARVVVRDEGDSEGLVERANRLRQLGARVEVSRKRDTR